MQLQKLIQTQTQNEPEIFLTIFTHVGLFVFTVILVMSTQNVHRIISYSIKSHFLTFCTVGETVSWVKSSQWNGRKILDKGLVSKI